MYKNITKIFYGRNKKCALFFFEASSSWGVGHLIRSLTLAKLFRSKGFKIYGMFIGDLDALRYASSHSEEEIFHKNISFLTKLEDADPIIKNLKPAIVIIDALVHARKFVYIASKFNNKILALDYFANDPIMPHAIISLIDQQVDSTEERTVFRRVENYFEGPEYAIIRDEFKEVRKRRAINNQKVRIKNILISFGGADPAGNSIRALNVVINWGLKLVVNLIVGPLFMKRDFLDFVPNNDLIEMRIHSSPSNIETFFENSDLIFCGGGGTLLEAMYVGLPAIVVAQNANEKRHAEYLASLNGCLVLDNYDLNQEPSINVREELIRNSRKIIDGLGTDRIYNVANLVLFDSI